MTTCWLEWGGDLQLNQNGGLVSASGWDEGRQRIERRMLTNAATTLPDGSKVAAGYIFDPGYGVGLRRLINQNPTTDFMNQLRRFSLAGVQQDAEVNSAIPPTVVLQKVNVNTFYLSIGLNLVNGTQGTVSFTVS